VTQVMRLRLSRRRKTWKNNKAKFLIIKKFKNKTIKTKFGIKIKWNKIIRDYNEKQNKSRKEKKYQLKEWGSKLDV
jgi:hypothetical protein